MKKFFVKAINNSRARTSLLVEAANFKNDAWKRNLIGFSVALSLTLSAHAGPEGQLRAITEKAKASAGSLIGKTVEFFDNPLHIFDVKISVMNEGEQMFQAISYPLISLRSVAWREGLKRFHLPVVSGYTFQNARLSIVSPITKERAQTIRNQGEDVKNLISEGDRKNPLLSDEALQNLEPGDLVRVELEYEKTASVGDGIAGSVIPIGGSGSLVAGDRVIITFYKIDGQSIRMDVSDLSSKTLSTGAGVGFGGSVTADSSVAKSTKINWRDYFSKFYSLMIAKGTNNGKTTSYHLDLTSDSESTSFALDLLNQAKRNPDKPARTGNDLRPIPRNAIENLMVQQSRLAAVSLIDSAKIHSEFTATRRNIGLASILGKLGFSFQFDNHYIQLEHFENGQSKGVQTFKTSEVEMDSTRRGAQGQEGRLASFAVTYSTIGDDYTQPQIDQLLEISAKSTRFASGNNTAVVSNWFEYFRDLLPEEVFNKVFTEEWNPERDFQRIDPKVDFEIHLNRDYLEMAQNLVVADQNLPAAETLKNRLIEHISTLNEKNVQPTQKGNFILSFIQNWFVHRFGRETNTHIDLESQGVRKDIHHIATILAEVLDTNQKKEKRASAFEEVRKSKLFRRVGLGFLLSLVSPEDFNKLVNIKLTLYSKDALGTKEPIIHEHEFGDRRDPKLVEMEKSINRSLGRETLPSKKTAALRGSSSALQCLRALGGGI